MRLIAFHNRFNRNIKVSFGALQKLSEDALSDVPCVAKLPTGTEPWGHETRWRNLDGPVKDAAAFLSEIGLARATAAFEDYLIGAKAEFNRAGLGPVLNENSGRSDFKYLDAAFGIDPSSIADLHVMAEFFIVARNCVVHRSNRASKQLAELRAAQMLSDTLERWPRRVGKWNLSLPEIAQGVSVDWRPRHAIMASDVFYRCAVSLDRSLVQMMGAPGLARMTAHWIFFSDPAVPCTAKLSPQTMVRSLLADRYKARGTTLDETTSLLRSVGKWDDVRAAFNKRYPHGPETSLASRRRARRKGKAR